LIIMYSIYPVRRLELMAITSTEEAASYRFQIIKPEDLNTSLNREIDPLVYTSLEIDYDRTEDELLYATDEASRTRLDPDRAFGGPLLKRRQSFSEARNILAYQDDILVGILPTANNASSGRHPLAGGLVEQRLKLSRPELVASKYRWVGLRARSSEQEPEAGEEYDPSLFYMIDMLGYLAAKQGSGKQPFSAYPHFDPSHGGGEKLWPETLASWGLQRNKSRPTEPIRLFGEDKDFVIQEPWGGVTAETVIKNILSKKGAQEILRVAHVRSGR
jgi:hypothetical protein